jgi:ABC-type Fe3+-hydroxamate transport system substrate-binding protein
MDLIHQQQPDLIIANKEENVKEQVEELAARYPVWISDVNNLEDACEMITQVGAMTGKERNALLLITKIRAKFSQLTTHSPKTKVAYLIWQNPYMTVGGDTFIHSMIEAAGFENIFAGKQRYPEVTLDDLRVANCELLLLSSEPFPFKPKHREELQALLPNIKILLVDGEMFSWYGSRMAEAPAYFNKLRERV